MRDMRRKEKAIDDGAEIWDIISHAKYITIAMSHEDEPYLVTLSHGADRENRVLYFHCAGEGKKVDILRENPVVWGQAILDFGYIDGKCDQLFACAHFRGKVSFLDSADEKRKALRVMIGQLESDPDLYFRAGDRGQAEAHRFHRVG